MRISVFGLGSVGVVSAACLARQGHEVIGCDVDAGKLELLRHGRSPIVEPGLDDLVAAAVASGRLAVTADVGEAVHAVDVAFICVGTPSRANGSQDLTAISRLAGQLGDALSGLPAAPLFVVRSTVLPGTVEGVIVPLLEARSGRRAGVDLEVAFQPEFLREGSAIGDYEHPPFTVVGVQRPGAAAVIGQLFSTPRCEFHVTAIRSAEMLKYCCNAFHALKVGFANEMGRMSRALDLDPHVVMALMCRDRQLNVSPAYLEPGFAFGGPCLPKDLAALLHLAQGLDVQTPILAGILPSNDLHIDRAVQLVRRANKQSVAMIGLGFKRGTDDLRESPLVVLAQRLLDCGLHLAIHDPDLDLSRLTGVNRRYIETAIPQIAALLRPSCSEMITASEVVVVGVRAADLTQAICESSDEHHVIVDLVNAVDRGQVRGTYCGL